MSPGCQNCYAEAFAKRTGNLVWGRQAERRFFGDKHWAEPVKWNRQAEAAGVRRRVFCASMADVFEDRSDLWNAQERLWELIAQTPSLDWLLLTKRPENVLSMVPDRWHLDAFHSLAEWPSNVWVGTTVEDQQRADERIPHLLNVPAPVRFLSCEPLLGPVDIAEFLPLAVSHPTDYGTGVEHDVDRSSAVDWAIVGGESGPRRREMDVEWARSLVEQVSAAGVPVFFKQVSAQHPGAAGPPDLERWKEVPR